MGQKNDYFTKIFFIYNIYKRNQIIYIQIIHDFAIYKNIYLIRKNNYIFK